MILARTYAHHHLLAHFVFIPFINYINVNNLIIDSTAFPSVVPFAPRRTQAVVHTRVAQIRMVPAPRPRCPRVEALDTE